MGRERALAVLLCLAMALCNGRVPPRLPYASPRPVVPAFLRFRNKWARACKLSCSGTSSHCVSPVRWCRQYGCMTAQFICRTHAPSDRLRTDRSSPRPSRRGLQTSGTGCRAACAQSPATGPNEFELQQEPASEPEPVPATAPDSTAVGRMLASVGMEKASGSSAGSATSSSVRDNVTSREISSSRKLLKLGGGPILYSILACRSLPGHRGRPHRFAIR